MNNEKLLAVWGMNGHYFDVIMNSCTQWLDDDEWRDYLFSQIGL
jgi:hypothetical protein